VRRRRSGVVSKTESRLGAGAEPTLNREP
jgi:hypothetical protein